MGFNFGAAAGGATKTAEDVWNLSQQAKRQSILDQTAQNQLDNTRGFQAAMQNVPQVGQANTAAGPTGYTDANGAPTQLPVDPALAAQIQRQGGANPQFAQNTQADQNQYVQQQALKFGQVGLAGQYALQTAEANKSVAQTTGQNQTNSIQSNVINAYKDGNDFNSQVGAQLKSGNVSDAGNAVISAAAAHGVGFTHFTNAQGTPMIQLVDNTGRPQGQPYDFSNPANVQLAASAVAQRWGQSNVAQANPALGIEQQKANASTTSAGAQAQNADTTQSLAPSEITRNLGQANMSNAEAALEPARAGALNAQAADSMAGAGYKGAETTGVTQNNDQSAIANDMKTKYDQMDPADQQGPKGQALMQAIAQHEPGTAGARAMASMYTANQRAATVAATNAVRYPGGVGGANSNFKESQTTPGLWVNAKNGQSIQFDPKTGAPLKVVNNGAPPGSQAAPSGVRMAKNAAGQVGYQAADGSWKSSETEALQSFGSPAGTQGAAASAPVVNRPPLLNGQIPPAVAMSVAGQPAPYPGLPNN